MNQILDEAQDQHRIELQGILDALESVVQNGVAKAFKQ